MILRKLKEAAEAYLGEKVTKAVITVPAYFNDSQRQATKDAGKIAGLEVLRIINEPTAAALAYGLDKKKDETDRRLRPRRRHLRHLDPRDRRGRLRGQGHQRRHAPRRRRLRPARDRLDRRRVQEGARHRPAQGPHGAAAPEGGRGEGQDASCSTTVQTEINLPFITADADRPQAPGDDAHPGQVRAARGRPHRAQPSSPAAGASKDAACTPADIDEVVLVGGQTRMPKVQEMVKKLFGKEPHKGVNPDEVVARRRGHPGGVLAGEVKDVLLLDVTPLSLGIETLGGVMTRLIPRNTTIPTQEDRDLHARRRTARPSVEIHVLQGERPMAQRQPDARPVPPRRHPAGAARRAADRGDVRHRRQRHPQRVGARTRRRASSRRSPSRPRRA